MTKNRITKVELNEINLKIVLLFLEKLEKLTQQERKEILRTICLINYPVFIVENKDN